MTISAVLRYDLEITGDMVRIDRLRAYWERTRRPVAGALVSRVIAAGRTVVVSAETVQGHAVVFADIATRQAAIDRITWFRGAAQ